MKLTHPKFLGVTLTKALQNYARFSNSEQNYVLNAIPVA